MQTEFFFHIIVLQDLVSFSVKDGELLFHNGIIFTFVILISILLIKCPISPTPTYCLKAHFHIFNVLKQLHSSYCTTGEILRL